MAVTSKLIRYGPTAGFVGSAFFVVASVVAAAFYLDTQNEAFSPLNHWVSELGELVSIATVLEWLVLFGIMGWVLLASVTWWRFARGSRLTA